MKHFALKRLVTTIRAAKLIDNWRQWCHTGPTVVPVDFTREVDRFDAREPVLVPWAEAVERIYRSEFDADARRAAEFDPKKVMWPRPSVHPLVRRSLVIAHEVFGGKKHTHRNIGVTKREVVEIMLAFGDRIDLIDARMLPESKIPQAPPMVTFDEYRYPVVGVKKARMAAFLKGEDGSGQ